MTKKQTAVGILLAVVCLSFFPSSFPSASANENKTPKVAEFRYTPFEQPKVKSLAECILLLQPKQTPFVAHYIALNVLNESQAKNLDPDLVLALMFVESSFITHSASKADAVGLMQVRYPTWKLEPELVDNGVDKRSKLYWIDLNIKCGTDILARYYDESGKNIAKALYRYYSGDTKLAKKPWEIEYINKIMYYYYRIREHQINGTPLEQEEEGQVFAQTAHNPQHKK